MDSEVYTPGKSMHCLINDICPGQEMGECQCRGHLSLKLMQRQVDIRETPRQVHCTKGMTKEDQPWDGKTMGFESDLLALTPKPWGSDQCLPNLRVLISNVGTKMFTPQGDYEHQMRSSVGSSLTGRPSFRLGALSLPCGSTEEGAARSGLTKVALFYLGHSTCLSPKAPYSQGLLAAF